MRCDVSAIRRFEIPFDGLNFVDRNAEPLVVDQGNVVHRVEVTVLGQWQPLLQCRFVVSGVERIQPLLEVSSR